jgi:hypothetical protein
MDSDEMTNPVVDQKRNELLTYIERELVDEPAVQAVIAIGSVATGLARADSDFADEILVALNAPGLDYQGYQLRGALLSRCFHAMIDK